MDLTEKINGILRRSGVAAIISAFVALPSASAQEQYELTQCGEREIGVNYMVQELGVGQLYELGREEGPDIEVWKDPIGTFTLNYSYPNNTNGVTVACPLFFGKQWNSLASIVKIKDYEKGRNKGSQMGYISNSCPVGFFPRHEVLSDLAATSGQILKGVGVIHDSPQNPNLVGGILELTSNGYQWGLHVTLAKNGRPMYTDACRWTIYAYIL